MQATSKSLLMRPASRLLLAIATSILLHLGLAATHLLTPPPPKPVRLDVRLVVPPAVPEPLPEQATPPAPDILEKNTIATESPPPFVPPQPPTPEKRDKPGRLKATQEQQALRRLADYILYPQAAVDAGLEGTAHLLLKLDANGTIVSASIAASSGHPSLDHAAIQAALRAGRLNTGGRSDFILPVTFRLQ